MCLYRNISTHSTINGPLGGFRFLAVGNCAAVNILAPVHGGYVDMLLLGSYLREALRGPGCASVPLWKIQEVLLFHQCFNKNDLSK